MADKSVFANQGPTKPSVPHSSFDLSHSNNLTARLGRAYPCLVYDAPAGSSFKIRPYVAFDMQPFVFPIQTNIRCHVKFYRVPKRILWKHFKEFIGQHGPNGSTANPYTMPFIKRVENFYKTRSLADYLGIPSTTVSNMEGTRQVPVSFVHSYRELSYDDGHKEFLPDNSFTNYLTLRHGFSFTCESDLDLSSPIFSFRFRLPAGKSVSDLTGKLYFAQPFEELVESMLYHGHYHHSFLSGMQENVDYFRAHVYELSFQSGGVLSEDDVTTGNWSYITGSVDDRMVTIVLKLPADFLQSRTGSYQFALLWPSSSYALFGFPIPTVNTTSFSGTGTPKEDATDIDLVSSTTVNDFASWDNCVYHFATAAVDSSTASHFRSVDGADPVLPLNALFFRAYEFIGNYFFRNERVTPFMKDGHPVFNEYITNDGDGADSSTPVDFFSVPYEYDLFTTCVKEPQFGNAPLVGITMNSADNSAVMHMQSISVDSDSSVLPSGSYDIGVRLDNDANIISISNYEEVADKPSVMRLQEAIEYGISINDFRNVNALQRFQERHLKAGTKYQNIVFEFFGTNPPIGEEYPTYLGGITSPIKVNKVTNMAETSEMQLGDFAGQGSFSAKGNRINCFCSEDSIIMGIVYFTCTPVYSQKLDRMWTKSHLLDYYNPQFANLGPQPVYRHQLCPLQLSNTGDVDDPSDLFSVFGYNRPFSEYVSMQDEVHGDFRESMQRYLLQRRFSGVPELNEDFININPDELTDVFSVLLNTDKIFGQIYFDMRAKLPIPRFAVPRII